MGRYQGLVFVIPAHNEAKTIFKVISKLTELGDVIVVDDFSSDETAKIANNSGAKHVIRTVNNLGYDGALTMGFKIAVEGGYRFFVTCDADGQHSIESIVKTCDLITQDPNIDLVIGERRTFQRPAEYVFALATRLIYGIRDPLCGLKAYSIKTYSIQGYFDQYRSIGTELSLRAAKLKLNIVQFKFEVLPRVDEPRFGTGIKANLRILKSMMKWFLFYQFKI